MIANIECLESNWNDLVAEFEAETLTDENAQNFMQSGRVTRADRQAGAGNVILDAIGSEAELDELYTYLVGVQIWKWSFDGKVDYETEYTGQHNDILATHKDHEVYDENGNVVSSQPASFDDPNWAHSWAGQEQNRFARAFDRSFDGSFE